MPVRDAGWTYVHKQGLIHTRTSKQDRMVVTNVCSRARALARARGGALVGLFTAFSFKCLPAKILYSAVRRRFSRRNLEVGRETGGAANLKGGRI